MHVTSYLLDNINRYYEIQLCYAELVSMGATEVKFDLVKGLFEFDCTDEVFKKILRRTSWLKNLNEAETSISRIINACSKVIWKYPDEWFSHLAYPFKARMRPQVARSLINICCPRDNGIVLDPFCGSGTTNVEAYLLGLNSVGIDIVPFYTFMSEAKIRFFSEDIDPFDQSHPIFRVIHTTTTMFKGRVDYGRRVKEIIELQEIFKKHFKKDMEQSMHEFHVGTATEIPYPDDYFDGIVTSPPYGTAIDYISENPGPKELMEIPPNLKPYLVLTKDEGEWKRLMKIAIKEMYRVLKKGGRLGIIVGNQRKDGRTIDLVGWTKKELSEAGFQLLYEFTELISSTGVRSILTDKILIAQK